MRNWNAKFYAFCKMVVNDVVFGEKERVYAPIRESLKAYSVRCMFLPICLRGFYSVFIHYFNLFLIKSRIILFNFFWPIFNVPMWKHFYLLTRRRPVRCTGLTEHHIYANHGHCQSWLLFEINGFKLIGKI
jgi:hypothetical protein